MSKKYSPYYRLYITFGSCDKEAADWLKQQPNQPEYIKSLILSEKRLREQGEDIIIEKSISKHDLQWQNNFELVQEFQKDYGRLPFHFEEYKGVNLGRWLSSRISRDKENPERTKLLQSIGAMDKWMQNYNLVLAYRDEFGRLPPLNATYHDCNIGPWLQRQRDEFYKDLPDTLTEDQRQKIKELSIQRTDWDTKYALVCEFIKEHNRLPAYKEVYRGIKIGRWVSYVKRCLDSEKDPEKVKKLNDLGIVIKQRKPRYSEKWEEKYILVKEFRETFGRLPSPSEEYRGAKIGKWYYHELRDHQNNTDRMEKLKQLEHLSDSCKE